MLSTSQIAFREKSLADPHEAEDSPRRSERESLLQARIKDLKLHLQGTPLERHIQQLYAELEAKGISFRPECYLSDQWGCPSGVPVIGLPFYLADPRLHTLEAELGGDAETDHDILMYLRHEAGHAFNYAYRLYDTEEWRKVFGDYSKPYQDDYKPRPFSRKYVAHISGWYAQKHPDEDFAETFAVWLTPGMDWAKRYAGWAALKKLQYVDEVIRRIGRAPPAVQLADRDLDVGDMEETVLDHYRQRQLEERVELKLREHLDQDLLGLFEPAETTSAASAETLVRAERQALIQSVTRYSGVSRAVIIALVDHLAERTAALRLTVHLDKTREYLTKLTSLVTALAMNYLYTDHFFEVD
ncbi:putative zinc-binding metallopeptidase [Stigmatella sp. ncwal1]|uniref:Zinc-binding metallopeptidase n=1 Tax=Stigmatella ashevillensis TaxID=2995309 RepID=A0ABT5D0S3_9BACT|nr:putative zinc-binding metallopeptidase [Stigmatella ashevillena]MDC0707264.1 putative zinc-binding metallopeptidase [Stigmatella ashevillena]